MHSPTCTEIWTLNKSNELATPLIEILVKSADSDDVMEATIPALARWMTMLDPSRAIVARDKLVEILGESTRLSVLKFTLEVLAALEPRSDASQVSRAWRNLIEILGKPDYKLDENSKNASRTRASVGTPRRFGSDGCVDERKTESRTIGCTSWRKPK